MNKIPFSLMYASAFALLLPTHLTHANSTIEENQTKQIQRTFRTQNRLKCEQSFEKKLEDLKKGKSSPTALADFVAQGDRLVTKHMISPVRYATSLKELQDVLPDYTSILQSTRKELKQNFKDSSEFMAESFEHDIYHIFTSNNQEKLDIDALKHGIKIYGHYADPYMFLEILNSLESKLSTTTMAFDANDMSILKLKINQAQFKAKEVLEIQKIQSSKILALKKMGELAFKGFKCGMIYAVNHPIQTMTGMMTATLSAAAAQQTTNEFRVNTVVNGTQEAPAITALTDGGLIIGWDGNPFGGNYDVYGQRFDSNISPVGEEFKPSSYLGSSRYPASLVGLDDGSYVFIWRGYGIGNVYGIFGQKYNSDDTPNGYNFLVSTTATYYNNLITKKTTDNGYLVGWQYSTSFYSQRYNSANSPNGSIFQSPILLGNNGEGLDMDILNDNSYIITYDTSNANSTGYDVFGQRFYSNNTLFSDVYRVNSFLLLTQEYPAVAALEDGGSIYAWASRGQITSDYHIFGQRYFVNNTQKGQEFQISTHTLYDQNYPTITALPDGGFVCGWQSRGQDGDGYGIFGQRYYANNTKYGNEFQVNTRTAGNQQYPKTATLADGRFAFTWQGPGSEGTLDIWARVFHKDWPLVSPFTTSVLSTAPLSTQALTSQPLTTSPLSTNPLSTNALTSNALTTQSLTTNALTTNSQTSDSPVSAASSLTDNWVARLIKLIQNK